MSGLWRGAPGLWRGGGGGAPTLPAGVVLSVTSPDATISGAGLVYTHTGPDGNLAIGGAASSAKTAGKFYFECAVTVFNPIYTSVGVGITPTNTVLTSNLGEALGAAAALSHPTRAPVVVNDFSAANLTVPMITGSVVGCAYDATLRQVRWSIDGSAWSPLVTLAATGQPIMPAVTVGFAGDTATCRFDPASWTKAPPDGTYGPWTLN